MFNKAAEKTTAQFVLLGTPFITVFLMTTTVTDPVNATKLAASGFFAFALFLNFIFFNFSINWANFRIFILLACCFVVASLNAVFQSDSPLTQNIYGSYGRNTGFIAYLLMIFICLGVLNLRQLDSFKKIIWALLIAGTINVIYCGWVLAFGDFLTWTNPYGNILGLFGNPDFISAFLGIFISTILAYLTSRESSWGIRLGALALAGIAFVEVLKSHAIQGVVVTVAGVGVIAFYHIRSKFKSVIPTIAYLAFSVFVGVLAILGTLQKGPLDFVYKRSVSLRGSYWKSAINMGMDHPLSGVGMDAYGDWYRRERPEIALINMPGAHITSNAAHNVILDFFAYGGWPLLLSYLAMLTMGAIAIVKVTLRKRQYDRVFVSMTLIWACYQLQSIISINQIGLAIWGWLLTGALIAYEFTTRNTPEENLHKKFEKNNNKKVTSGNSAGIISPQLVAGIGCVIGLFVAVPPLSADMKWRSALDSKSADQVVTALKPTYLTPSDSMRFAQAVQLFGNSNLLDQAREIAIQGTKYNPDFFDGWKVLYYLSNSTPAEKAESLKNMKRLDPRNPDVLAK